MAEQDFDIKIRTTADTAGVKQTEAELRRLETQATQAGANIGRLIAPFLSGFSAFKFVDQINVVAERLKQTSAELAKQGEQLVENGQRYQELAKAARTEADVIKIGSSALKDLEAAHKRVLDVQKEELTWWDKLTDAVYHQIQAAGTAATAAADAGRISKEALDLRIAGHQQLEDIARQELVGAIRSAEANKEAFDRRKAEPFEQAIGHINDQLKDQQAILAGIDYTKFPESWLATSKIIERLKGDLKEIVNLEKQAEAKKEEERGRAKSQYEAGRRELGGLPFPTNADAYFRNLDAARRASERGDPKAAEQLQKTADELRKFAGPESRRAIEELEKLKTQAGESRSPDVVDAIERMRSDWR